MFSYCIMVSKISNTNKSHIHIHIGDKEKKKKHRRRSTKHGRSHGGTYISNHISVPVLPLFNRPQYLDTTLGDAREKERVRIQRGEFLPQTPTNAGTTAFGDNVPTNEADLNFLSRLRKGYEDKYGSLDGKNKPVTFEDKPKDQSKARPGPFTSTPLRKKVEETEPEFAHKKSSPYAEPTRAFGGGLAGGGAVGMRREPPYDKESNQEPKHESPVFSHQVPPTTSSNHILHSDPVPTTHSEPMEIGEGHVHHAPPDYIPPPVRGDGPFTSRVRYHPGEGVFTSESNVRRGKFHKIDFRDTVSDAKSRADGLRRLPP